jgi:hypothetical protein
MNEHFPRSQSFGVQAGHTCEVYTKEEQINFQETPDVLNLLCTDAAHYVLRQSIYDNSFSPSPPPPVT